MVDIGGDPFSLPRSTTYPAITPAAKKVIYQPEARARDPVRFPRWRVGLICSSMRNFLAGVILSRSAILRSNNLLQLWNRYKDIVQGITNSSAALRLVDMLFEKPAVTISQVAERLAITFRTAQLNVEKLVANHILEEVTGKGRNRIYAAREIIATIQSDDDDGTTSTDDP